MSSKSNKIQTRLRLAKPKMKKLYSFCKSNYPDFDWAFSYEENYDILSINAGLSPDASDDRWERWKEIKPEIVEKIHELDIPACGILNGSEITCELDEFWGDEFDQVGESKAHSVDVREITEAILEGKNIRSSLSNSLK